MSDVVKDQSRTSMFGKFAGWRERKGETRFARPTDIPNRKHWSQVWE